VSLLKSYFGDKATRENDFGYHWMPKLDEGKSYSWLDLFDAMYKEKFTRLFCLGTEPCRFGGQRSNKTRDGLAKLDWMVNVNSSTTKPGLSGKGPGMDPQKHQNRSLYASLCRIRGKRRVHHQQRPLEQWRYKAADPPGRQDRTAGS
jgi:formate dehydrogenase major subunit